EPRYLAAAERALRLFYPAMVRHPGSCVNLASALEEHLVPPQIVVLRGDPAGMAAWQRALSARYRPSTLVVRIPPTMRELPPALDKSVPAAPGAVNAWV